jgi:hypothetical protein
MSGRHGLAQLVNKSPLVLKDLLVANHPPSKEQKDERTQTNEI